MSALALAHGSVSGRSRPRPALSLLGSPGGESTLDEFLSGVWEGLAVHRAVSCPWCGQEMHAVYGAHARPVEGRCPSCQTVLS